MLRKSWILALAGAVLAGAPLLAGTFGRVVAIGGAASDLALDEARGVLYISNFTANRIEVMALSNNTIQTSINVAAQPGSLSLSPDGRYLLVAHFGNNTAPSSPTNALTLIDLTANNAKQTFALGNPPLGVAFGADGKALVVTTQEYILFDPVLGTTQLLDTISNVTARTLPVPPANFPADITNASVAVSADGMRIYGMGSSTGTFTFRYNVATHSVSPGGVVLASGTLGPRVVSISADGSQVMAGWLMIDAAGTFLNDIPARSNDFSIGTTVFDSQRNLIYAHIPAQAGDDPVLQILDSDNLTLRERLKLPENTRGKSVMNSDQSVMYSVSDSGVLVLPIGNLNRSPRLSVSTPDLVFRGNFCDRRVATQTLTITDPGGGNTPFSITTSAPGISISPSSGLTPATVRISVDPNVYQNQKGTVTASLKISSSTGINPDLPVRLLINSREPDQRGTFVNIPGRLVDLVSDPVRDRYYLLRQDTNEVLVFNGSNNTQVASLRTYNVPTSLAITLDNRYLLVGHQHSQAAAMFDLETLQPMPYISTSAGAGNTIRSLVVTTKAILATSVDYQGKGHVLRLDLPTRSATQLSSLGVYENTIATESVLATSSNNSKALLATADGYTFLYDANVDSFTVSRHDFNALSGAYAASAFDQFVVGNALLNSSLVKIADFETATGRSSGFAFVDQQGLRINAPDDASPGVIQRVDTAIPAMIRPTRTVEAPILSQPSDATVADNTCVTSTTKNSNGNTVVTTCRTGTRETTDTCLNSTTGQTTTNSCTSTSRTVNLGGGFTRTLAPLANRTSIIALTTSGFTVLPWAYDAAVAPPKIASIASAADGRSPAAPGGLVSIFGSQLSPTNLATREIPVPTALGDSCLTVNGQPMPMIFVSPTQINAQMPFQAIGNVTVVVHTPGGVSDNYNMVVQPTAPAVFRSGVAGDDPNVPTIMRSSNNLLVTDTNPVHRNEELVIYLTGLGAVSPTVDTGLPAPADPLAQALTTPVVRLGGVDLPVDFAGLAPGEVGVYQINVRVPGNAPQGLSVPLTITQGDNLQTLNVRVVQ
jgi:uncharacterized protein (TIGR03437 family)